VRRRLALPPEKVERGEDKERSCPRCRSNSIRHLKNVAEAAAKEP